MPALETEFHRDLSVEPLCLLLICSMADFDSLVQATRVSRHVVDRFKVVFVVSD